MEDVPWPCDNPFSMPVDRVLHSVILVPFTSHFSTLQFQAPLIANFVSVSLDLLERKQSLACGLSQVLPSTS